MGASRRTSKGRTALLFGFIIALSFLSVFGVAVYHEAGAVSDDTYEYLNLFNEVLTVVQHDYVKEVDTKKLIHGAIKGMLSELDPHTVFIDEQSFKQMMEDIKGEFGGLGIQISMKDKKLIIIAPIEDTPAWDAGLKAGDWITDIEGEPTRGITLNEAVHKMRGPVGTSITISVLRKGLDEPKDYTIVRAEISIISVKDPTLMKGDIGYLRLTAFSQKSSQEMKVGISKIITAGKGKPLKGLILDLRGNPGGSLDQAVAVSDMFVDHGNIVSVKGRVREDDIQSAHQDKTVLGDVPMIVLVNQHSASASEIVAGALQDHGRAVILGKTTFGKGSVQNLRTMQDGSGLKITISYYYTPSGRSIQEYGITPDIEVDELSPEQKLKLKEAKTENLRYYREKDLEHHFTHEDVVGTAEGDSVEGNKDVPEKDLLPEKVGEDTDDYQLQRALDLLRSFDIFQAVIKKKAS